MRVYVESRSHEPPNLRAASASIVMGGGGEKSMGVRETQESRRDGRVLSARRSAVLGRSLCQLPLLQSGLQVHGLQSLGIPGSGAQAQ